MKVAALYSAYRKHPDKIHPILVHTDQHTGAMSDSFFTQFKIPKADYHLGANGLSPCGLFSKVVADLEPILEHERPDLLLVVGDVNSTLAATLAATKIGIPVAHVEAGLRSGDRTMPEEINRIATDHLSDILFVTEASGMKNLKKEGIPLSRTHLVGNVMIDTLISQLPSIDDSRILSQNNLSAQEYAVLTLHRPANVNDKKNLRAFVRIIRCITKTYKLPILFPIHPRTRGQLAEISALKTLEQNRLVHLLPPLEYVDFLKAVKESAFVLTDSGGIQEEAAYLRIPTITLRTTTERPSTLKSGANQLVPDWMIYSSLEEAIKRAIRQPRSKIRPIPLFDGKAAERIVQILLSEYKIK